MKLKIKNNKLVGINDVNEKLYQQFLLINNENDLEYEIGFSPTTKLVSDKQLKLYNFIVLKVMEYSGQDFHTIDKQFKTLLPERIELDEKEIPVIYKLKMEAMEIFEFEEFLIKVLDYVDNFFDIKIQLNNKNGKTDIKITT